MAVDQNEVNALLEARKDKYRSEQWKILDQEYSKIALDENLKIPSLHGVFNP